MNPADEAALVVPVIAGFVAMAVTAWALAMLQVWWRRRGDDTMRPVQIRPRCDRDPRPHWRCVARPYDQDRTADH